MIYSLLFLLSFGLSVFIAVFVYFKNPKNSNNKMYLYYILLCSSYSLIRFGMLQSGSEGIPFWSLFVFWPFIIAIQLHFVLVFTEMKRLYKNIFVLAGIYLSASFIAFYLILANLVKNWGLTGRWVYFILKKTPGEIISIWTIILIIISFIICLYFFIIQKNEKKKKQALFILIGLFVPTIINQIFNGILPYYFNIHLEDVGVFSNIFSTLIIGYAVWKFELFVLKPEHVAENIISTIPDLLLVTDQDYIIKVVNYASKNLLHYKEKELIDKPIKNIFKKELQFKYVNDHIQEMIQNKSFIKNIESEFISKDNKIIPLSLSISFIGKPKDVMGIIFVCRDITEKKISEEKLRKRSEELNYANKELESFAYSVSHDLRAPLRHINGFSNILLKESDKLDSKDKKFLNNIIISTNEMQQLINDLLSFSRMSRTKIRNIKNDIKKMIYDIKEVLTDENKKFNIKWNIGILPEVYCDGNLIKQVFINLISNSIKFSKSKSRIILEIDSETNDDEVIFSVKDNGIGINMKYADKIFNVFQRLHSDKEYEGTGIGLAIVKRIVDRHKGRIWIESVKKKGTTVFFSLPKNRPEI